MSDKKPTVNRTSDAYIALTGLGYKISEVRRSTYWDYIKRPPADTSTSYVDCACLCGKYEELYAVEPVHDCDIDGSWDVAKIIVRWGGMSKNILEKHGHHTAEEIEKMGADVEEIKNNLKIT